MKTAGLTASVILVGAGLGLAAVYLTLIYGGDWLEKARLALR
jgi:hypothetical protein